MLNTQKQAGYMMALVKNFLTNILKTGRKQKKSLNIVSEQVGRANLCRASGRGTLINNLEKLPENTKKYIILQMTGAKTNWANFCSKKY